VKRFAYFVTSVLVSVVFINPIANAGQQQWGSAYLDWSGSLLSADSSISQIIQPLEISPKTYWEAGWHWDNAPDGGYGGIQSNGILADGTISDLAIFSIWNGLGAIPGDGAGCTRFGGEGIGYSCRIPITLNAGNKYEISFAVDKARGPQWWVATIADISKGTKKVIGSIETISQNAKASNWNNFIEYWGAEVPCDAVGPASAKFYVPSSSNENVEIHSPTFSRPAHPCVMSAGDTPPPGFIGDAVIRFGGPKQEPSTQTMPYTKTKGQLAIAKVVENQSSEMNSRIDATKSSFKRLNSQIDSLIRKYPSQKPNLILYKNKAALFENIDQRNIATAEVNLLGISSKITGISALYKKLARTVTCTKGIRTLKVTDVNPACPTGFRVKK
jgi:hypothetical protein